MLASHPSGMRQQACRCAAEVEASLRGDGFREYLGRMYGDAPKRWSEHLAGWDRLRFITNCLTRLRYCGADGTLALEETGPPSRRTRWIDTLVSGPGTRERRDEYRVRPLVDPQDGPRGDGAIPGLPAGYGLLLGRAAHRPGTGYRPFPERPMPISRLGGLTGHGPNPARYISLLSSTLEIDRSSAVTSASYARSSARPTLQRAATMASRPTACRISRGVRACAPPPP